MLENKLYSLGFEKLQEKENMIYFEKGTDDERVYLIYDKKKGEIKSLDRYKIADEEMWVTHNKQEESDVIALLFA